MKTSQPAKDSTATSASRSESGKPFFLPANIQAKLTINQPNDAYEQEADAVADQVMRMPEVAPRDPFFKPSFLHLQRKCTHCEEEEKKEEKEETEEDKQKHFSFEEGTAPPDDNYNLHTQRKCNSCGEEEKLQLKRENSNEPDTDTTPLINEVMQSAGTPLQTNTKHFFESKFRYDFSDVKIHNDSKASMSASRINAQAYTHKKNIVFSEGKYDPGSDTGKHLLAHELTHVIQQNATPAVNKINRQEAPAVSPVSAAATTASPVAAAMSVSMHGIMFTPPAGNRFSAGLRATQGLAIILQRLCPDYAAGLETQAYDFLVANGGIDVSGDLVGNASGGEEMHSIHLGQNLAITLLAWLEDNHHAVTLSTEQRDLLRFGNSATQAWTNLTDASVAAELGIQMPAWMTSDYFLEQVSRRIDLLRVYMDAKALFELNRTPENRQQVISALQNIFQSVNPSIAALEAIRTDEQLRNEVGYRVLFGVNTQPITDTPGSPVQVSGIGFLAYVDTQTNLRARAPIERAARQELLHRFVGFLGNALPSATGDQHVSARPGRANAPALQSRLSAYPEVGPPAFLTALNTDYTFDMSLQFPDVFEAFSSYSYYWDYVEVNPQSPSAPQVSQTQGWGSIASQRFSQANRYGEEDLDRIMNDLGPSGVTASLVVANNILRYVSTGIHLGFEILLTPRSEKHLVFPHEGVYIVRAKATPITGDDAAMTRESSVAYLPVIAKRAQDMAAIDVTNQVNERTTSLARIAELRALLAEPVTHYNQGQLEEELRQLTAVYGSAADLLTEQLHTLEASLSTLRSGTPEYESTNRQITSIRQILEVRTDRGRSHDLSHSERLQATFVSDQGQTVRLLMEAVRVSDTSYWVSDLTTPNSSQEQGNGSNRSEAILNAVQQILEGIHGYGRGQVVISIDDVQHTKRIAASAGSILSEAIENITTVLSIVAVVAAPFTAGGSLALLLPIGAIGAIPSAYRLISRGIDDTFRFDLATAMDIVNIASGFLGLAEAAIPARASVQVARIGTGIMVLGVAANGTGILLMGAQVISQLSELEGLPPGLRYARTMEILGGAMLNAGIMIGAALAQRGAAARREQIAAHPETAAPHTEAPALRAEGTTPHTEVAPHQEPVSPHTDTTGPRPESELPHAEPPATPSEVHPPEAARPNPEAAPSSQGEHTTSPRDTAQTAVEHRTRRTETATSPESGHELRQTDQGVAFCSFPCSWFEDRYRNQFNDNPTWGTEWETITHDLENAVRNAGENSGMPAEAAAWQRVRNFQDRLEAAHSHYNTTLSYLRANYPHLTTELTAMEATLTAHGQAAHCTVLNELARMEQSGRLTGFEAWISDMATRAGDIGQVMDAVAEAQAASLLAEQTAGHPGQVVVMVPRHAGGHGGRRSFDFHIEDRSRGTNQVTRRSEVFNEDRNVSNAATLTAGIAHGPSKISGRNPATIIPGAEMESIVRVHWPPQDTANRHFDTDGSYVQGPNAISNNLFDETLRILNSGGISGIDQFNRVTITDQGGNVLYTFMNTPPGLHWTIDIANSPIRRTIATP